MWIKAPSDIITLKAEEDSTVIVLEANSPSVYDNASAVSIVRRVEILPDGKTWEFPMLDMLTSASADNYVSDGESGTAQFKFKVSTTKSRQAFIICLPRAVKQIIPVLITRETKISKKK